MQYDNINDTYKQLSGIIEETRSNYRIFIESNDERYVEYPYMPLTLMASYATDLEKESENLNTNILRDIVSLNSKDAIIGNIYQNLMHRSYARFFNYSDEEFNKVLIFALKQRYYLLEDIERKIRDIFAYILMKRIDNTVNHITKSNLNDIRKNIHFKYAASKEDDKKHILNTTKFIMANVSTNKADYFYKSYLDNLITRTIDTLLEMTNETLASDREYAKAICLQCLLRSIFVIIDDYKELIPYEEYYNEKEKNETIAKGMVRDAFVRYYNDSYNNDLKILAKQNY